MGVVHKAEDIRLRRLVALKFLSGALAHEPAALDGFAEKPRRPQQLPVQLRHKDSPFQGYIFSRLESGPHSSHAIGPALPSRKRRDLYSTPVHLPDSESETKVPFVRRVT